MVSCWLASLENYSARVPELLKGFVGTTEESIVEIIFWGYRRVTCKDKYALTFLED